MTINPSAIPVEIRTLPRWIRWRSVPDDPKPRKVPVRPSSPGNASTTDPETWGTFDEALSHVGEDNTAGLGFVFSKDDRIVGVDLDDCLTDGSLSEKASDLVARFGTYVEKSPSGRGIHLIGHGSLNGHRGLNRKKESGIEVYDSGRYFTMTGEALPDTLLVIAECQSAIDALVAELEPPPRPTLVRPSPAVEDFPLSDRIKRASAYLAKISPSVAGQAGDAQAFEAAAAIIRGFALPEDVGFDLLWTEWNPICVPPWTEQRIRHKARQGFEADRPLGYLLGEPTPRGLVRLAGRVLTGATAGAPAQTPPPVDEAFHLTDYGNAERFVKRHGAVTRYCFLWDQWLIWDGRRWAPDVKEAALELAKDTVRSIYDEIAVAGDSEERKALFRHAQRSESDARLRAVLSVARSEAGLPVLPDQLDADPWLLNLENGILDLRTGKLEPHDQGRLMAKLLPVTYDASADAPIWLSFLDRVMGGKADLIEFLQRAVGYSLTGNTREQCLFVLHGTGSNGKSSFLDTARAFLGEYAEQADPKTFEVKKSDTVSNDIARLKGARLVAASETESGGRLAESLVKQMTGGEPLTARFLHREFFTFRPEFKVWLATNHKPVIRGADNAIWRRIRLVPFDVVIPPEERDKDLLQKLRGELPGILAWAVRGCLAWQRDGLREPESVLSATAEYRAEMDVLGEFFEERCHFDGRSWAFSSELYKEYLGWSEGSKEYQMSRRTFGMSLTERGLRRKQDGYGRQIWIGIGLGANQQQNLDGTADTADVRQIGIYPPRSSLMCVNPDSSAVSAVSAISTEQSASYGTADRKNPSAVSAVSAVSHAPFTCPSCGSHSARSSKSGKPICTTCFGG